VEKCHEGTESGKHETAVEQQWNNSGTAVNSLVGTLYPSNRLVSLNFSRCSLGVLSVFSRCSLGVLSVFSRCSLQLEEVHRRRRMAEEKEHQRQMALRQARLLQKNKEIGSRELSWMRQEEAGMRSLLEQRQTQYWHSVERFKQIETTRERRETTRMHQEEQYQNAYAQWLWVVAADRKNAVGFMFTCGVSW
jgi:hypothetical protein